MSRPVGARDPGLPSPNPTLEDRRRAIRRRRIGAGAVLLVVVLAIALVLVSSGNGSARREAAQFMRAWEHGDYAAMYRLLDTDSQGRTSEQAFAGAYRGDARVATMSSLRAAGPIGSASGGALEAPVSVHTRIFGTFHEHVLIPITGSGSSARVAWNRTLLFPGLQAGETLSRNTMLPPRASLLARDGSILASGPAQTGSRYSSLGSVALPVIGEVGPIPSAERDALEAQGVPPDAILGTSGLELTFDAQLRGQPGGQLFAGRRVLASSHPVPSGPVRTSIDPALQNSAVQALGGQYGGVVVLRPSDGQILAVAGLGVDDTQPPGSTFKMVTVTGVLQYRVATPSTEFPYATEALLDGVPLQDANGEDCGGTLAYAFAVSCNSVYAPLGAKLGAARLSAVAEAYGFNHPTGIPGTVESTFPTAGELNSDLAVGSAAIGQDEDLASPLEMALVATTIADGGRRPPLSFLDGPPHIATRVTSPHVAHEIRAMMELVVSEGTGTAAQIPGVVVAGKTGTAELTTTASCAPGASNCSSSSNPQDTDAWFAAFAPAIHPKLAVCVMLVADGAGGNTAAPIARQILQEGLQVL
ncbi:MAG TPA: penicillin-binding transpeptidase domain-containing protein [Solirubrobacteraceae bacterium]|nr:penicillin-binding transpeptidase domain-containing protein [Solirubrobacteraceae bacterium]